jgi:hypothetical protein
MQQILIIYRLYSLFCIQSVIFCLESCVCGLWSANDPSTTVENPLQISLFMQNKPNVKDAKMNISPFMTIKYVKLDTWLSGKNKPNQTQLKPKQTQSTKRPKMNLNTYPTRDYSNKTALRRKQNKPNQSQFQTQLLFCPPSPLICTNYMKPTQQRSPVRDAQNSCTKRQKLIV